MGAPGRAHARLRRDPAQGLAARRADGARRLRDLRAVRGPDATEHGEAAAIDPAHRRGAGLDRGGRRRAWWSSPPRSPTAGSRWDSVPACSSRLPRRARRGVRAPRRSACRTSSRAVGQRRGDRRRARDLRRDEAAHVDVRRRHGASRDELPQPVDGARRLSRRRREDPGAVPRRSAREAAAAVPDEFLDEVACSDRSNGSASGTRRGSRPERRRSSCGRASRGRSR